MAWKFSVGQTPTADKSPAIQKIWDLIGKLSAFKQDLNCQKFSAAFELLNRDIKVKVTSSISAYDRVYDTPVGAKEPVANWCLNRNVKFIRLPDEKFLEFINTTMVKAGSSARGMLGVRWIGEPGGHIVNLCVADGVTWMVDAMRGRVRSLLDPNLYLRKWVDPKRSLGFFRIDNLLIDKEMMTDSFETNTKIYDLDNRKDPRYTSIAHLLAAYGKEHTKFKIFKRGSYVGTLQVTRAVYSQLRKDHPVCWKYIWLKGD